MRTLRVILIVLALGVVPLRAADQPTTMSQVEDRIISQEHAEMTALKQYTPLVETYIQIMKADKDLGAVPAGDKYYLGRAVLAKGVDLEQITDENTKHKLFSGLAEFSPFSLDFEPRGFLQMIYLDNAGLDREHYSFDYVRREFLGEIRCLVFDITPDKKAGKSRFVGRIWVEDQDFHIVRFNGRYSGSSSTDFYFHFDSWRVNSGPGLWLPAFIYSEEENMHYAVGRTAQFKAQTRLWGYNLGHSKEEQELSRVLVEAPTPVQDQAQQNNDLSPVQAQRSWDLQAEDNIIDRLERLGLLAPPGEVDKVLSTVVNNLEVTNNLDIEPEIRCRVLLTSTLESFTLGHTIVLSRGLIDVLPDEASLAAILAHEVGHVVLAHRVDTQFAFFDTLQFNEKDTFKHFGFARTKEEEDTANAKANELLKNSPYKDQLATAQLFLQALAQRQKEIPNLISPNLGDRVTTGITLQASVAPAPAPAPAGAPPAANAQTQIVALPLGGRVKMDPWNDQLEMLKSKPIGTIAEREKMPFEVTPFMLYLTREPVSTSLIPSAVSASTSPNAQPEAPAPQSAPAPVKQQ